MELASNRRLPLAGSGMQLDGGVVGRGQLQPVFQAVRIGLHEAAAYILIAAGCIARDLHEEMRLTEVAQVARNQATILAAREHRDAGMFGETATHLELVLATRRISKGQGEAKE